jgi:amino-acid N-acetyltransferase
VNTPIVHRARIVRRTNVAQPASPPHLRANAGRARLVRTAPVFRQAVAADAVAIHALVLDHLDEGHLLPRRLEDIQAHAGRFVVASIRGRVVACAELAPLSASVAEVRSLVVGAAARSRGVGQTLVTELMKRARLAGYSKLCAFAHAPAYFVRMGFSIVPHTWLPEKIDKDCAGCAHFRTCGQFAVIRDLCQ